MSHGDGTLRRDDDDPVCAAIRRAREAAGLTQSDLAIRVGVRQAHVSRWEHGVRPTLERLAEIERALQIRRGDLLRAAGFVDD